MPELARFLGIVISMLYDDHAPHISMQHMEITELVLKLKQGQLKGNFQKGH